MEALYNRTIRIILGLPKATSGAELLHFLNIPSMKERIAEIYTKVEKRDKINISLID